MHDWLVYFIHPDDGPDRPWTYGLTNCGPEPEDAVAEFKNTEFGHLPVVEVFYIGTTEEEN